MEAKQSQMPIDLANLLLWKLSFTLKALSPHCPFGFWMGFPPHFIKCLCRLCSIFPGNVAYLVLKSSAVSLALSICRRRLALSTVATRTWRVKDKAKALNECQELLLADQGMGAQVRLSGQEQFGGSLRFP